MWRLEAAGRQRKELAFVKDFNQHDSACRRLIITFKRGGGLVPLHLVGPKRENAPR
jgi:hypothetical protein